MGPVEKSVKLSSGFDMPTVGLGTFTTSNNPEDAMAKVIKEAINIGYRHIDTAQVDGTESLIGLALAPLLKGGVVKREELFFTTKIRLCQENNQLGLSANNFCGLIAGNRMGLGPDGTYNIQDFESRMLQLFGQKPFQNCCTIPKVWSTNHHPEHVKSSTRESLENLKLNYIDLLLIHWPMAYANGGNNFPKKDDGNLICTSDDYLDTWKAMEELVEEGQVKSIGLSNFNIQQIQRVMDNCKIQPCNLQVELNAYHNNKQVADFCLKNDITVSCYSPFGNQGWTRVNESGLNLSEEPVVKALAERLGKKTSQVLLRFLLQKGYTVLPKSGTESRLAENFAVMNFELNNDDMSEMDKLNRDRRVYDEPIGVESEFYPF